MAASIAEARARAFDIIRRKSFARREIVLASGQKSDHYFDMKPAMFDPEGTTLLAELILDRLAGVKADYVGGLEMGAVPLVGPVSMLSHMRGRPIPGFFVRKTVKEHGTRKLIEGPGDLRGKSVVIVEDVTTTGQSAMAAVKALQEAGASVALVISIVDRQQGAGELYAKAGLPFQSLFTSGDFLKAVPAA
jgi:orotate phosphoribosyltransferase